jgi:hypothetical protein
MEKTIKVDYKTARKIQDGKQNSYVLAKTEEVEPGLAIIFVPKSLPKGTKGTISLFQSNVVVREVITKKVHKGFCIVVF